MRRAETYLKDMALTDDEDRDQFIDNYWKHYETLCQIAAKMESIHLKHRIEAGVALPLNTDKIVTSCQKDKWFFVTIRPNKKTFSEFKERIESKVLIRKMILDIKYCYEQKGTTDETLGTGHHLHGIIKCPNYYTPGNLARDLLSSLNGFCGNSGVKVQTTKNPEEHFKRYYENHSSEDGHKEITKEWDYKWRNQLGLQDVYISPKPSTEGDILDIRGPEQAVVSIKETNFKFSID